MIKTNIRDSILRFLGHRDRRLARFVAVDATLQQLKRRREQVTPLLGKSCAAFVATRGWKWFGAARLSDHATERFGRSSRWVRDLAAIGRGMADLPGFERVVTGDTELDGKAGRPLGRTAAARLARVATPDSFAHWLTLARDLDTHGFRDAVRAAKAAGSVFPLRPSSSGPGPPPHDRLEKTTDQHGDDTSADTDGNDAPTVELHDPDPECEQTIDTLVQLFLPGKLKSGFEDILELHRAVSGGQVPVWDFVEALVAEAIASSVSVAFDDSANTGAPALPRSLELNRMLRIENRAAIERRLAASSGRWSWLDEENPDDHRCGHAHAPLKADHELQTTLSELLLEAGRLCKRLNTIGRRAGLGRPAELHDQIVALQRLDDAIERLMGQLLGWISRHRTCAENLFTGVGHYAEERLGMHRREAQLRAGVDRGLTHFPLLRQAYRTGELRLEAADIVLRILGHRPVAAEVEAAWVRHAKQATIRRLRDEARSSLRKWYEEGDSSPPMPLDDETWLRSLALFPGTTRRRLRRLVEDTRPGHRSVEEGTTLAVRLPADLADAFVRAIEDRRRRCVAGLDPAPSATRLAKLFSAQGRSVPAWVGLLALLEEYTETWDAPDAFPRRRFTKIYARHGWRCAVPGCTSRCHLESHHLIYQSRGGSDAPWNLVALCRFHHALGMHGGLASSRGKAPLGIVWRLGHPRVGLWFVNDRVLEQAGALAADMPQVDRHVA